MGKHMKVSISLLALFAALTALPSLMAGEPKPSPFLVDVCPYGHTTLTNIPIKYGLIIPSPETIKAQDNYQYVSGGCCFHPGSSPTNAILCTTCNFLYQLHDLFSPEEGYWNRRLKDRQSFQQIFPTLIQEFPIPDQKLLLDTPKYWQSSFITNNVYKMKYGYEVKFITTMSLDAMKEQIKQYLEKNNLITQYSERIDSTPTRMDCDTYTWTSKVPSITIIVFNNLAGTNNIHVSVIQSEDKEKPNQASDTIGAEAAPQH
jgi:hypothetical protein